MNGSSPVRFAAARNAARSTAVAFAWLIAMTALSLLAGQAAAQEARWIWAPDQAKNAVPTGEACHFRKTINIRAPEGGQISIKADDQYELYVNGRRVGAGEAVRKLDEYDISKQLVRGVNIIAIKVINKAGDSAALAARITIKENGQWSSHSTDPTWKTSRRALPL